MFIGHFAVGLASKRFAPRSSLGVLVAAPLLLDLVWPVLVLTGLERVRIEPGNTAFTPLSFEHYPISHSLLMVMIWALLAAILYWAVTRYRRGAIVVGAGVASHWVLDAIAHRPDLPLYPGSAQMAGFGLWNSVPATIAVEMLLFSSGVWLYMTCTRARDRAGRVLAWAFIFHLIGIYIVNAVSPPPPGVQVVAVTALALWLFLPWAAWLDRHRVVVAEN